MSYPVSAKQCGGTEEFPIVRQVWKHLDLPPRRTIDESIDGSTIIGFINIKDRYFLVQYKQYNPTRVIAVMGD
jgi:hypothetical protein